MGVRGVGRCMVWLGCNGGTPQGMLNKKKDVYGYLISGLSMEAVKACLE